MSEVFIPLGGAGGKNRGGVAIIDANATIQDMYGMVTVPLPAGNYKKYVANGEAYMPGYGDGKNAVLGLNKEFIKKAALHAFGIASITNFSATMYAHKQVRLTWARPTKGLWSGVHLVFKYDSMPTSVTDGFYTLDIADVYCTPSGLEERQLYIRAFNYVTTNEGRWYDSGNVSSTIRVSGISGSVTFGAGAGTWTVPEGVRRIRYILVGQGGEGGWNSGFYAPGGGGGGGYFTTGYMDVTPGQSIPWIIPSASADFDILGGVYKQGLDTVFGSIRSQHGRSPLRNGFRNYNNHLYSNGGDGGSGGAAYNGSPGSNGNDGIGSYPSISEGRRGDKTTYYFDSIRPGYGQHTSTTGFNGVLYSTGGMAGNRGNDSEGASGTNGLGNGGNGANTKSYGKSHGGGRGGTGCIYIAWGSSMNDGS